MKEIDLSNLCTLPKDENLKSDIDDEVQRAVDYFSKVQTTFGSSVISC